MQRQDLEREQAELSEERQYRLRLANKLNAKLVMAGASEAARIEVELEDHKVRMTVIETRLDEIMLALTGAEVEEAAPDPNVLAAQVIAWLRDHGDGQDIMIIQMLAGVPDSAVWQEAWLDFINDPEDTDALGAARMQLKKLLVRNDKLARRVFETITDAGQNNAAADSANVDRSLRAGGDIRVSGTLITGDIQGNVTIGH